jgi:two-component system LytT family response regulator
MIRAAIVDDERLARSELRRLLATHSNEITVVGEAANAAEAEELIHTENPDLLFLDIQMPGKTGFDLLQELESAAPVVIFTTAYDQYAIQAFEVNALDYLLKPIEAGRLAAAIVRAGQKLAALAAPKTPETEETNNKPVHQHRKLTATDQVFVKDGEKCWFVRLADIRLFESVGNYARVYFGDNRPLILKSLNALEERLDEKLFFRANRQYIVNLQWITAIEPWFSGGLRVTLRPTEQIEISRRQAARFKDMMSL